MHREGTCIRPRFTALAPCKGRFDFIQSSMQTCPRACKVEPDIVLTFFAVECAFIDPQLLVGF